MGGLARQLTLALDASGHEGAVRLMEDHFVDDCLATEFNRMAFQLGNLKAAALLGQETIGWLVVGLEKAT